MALLVAASAPAQTEDALTETAKALYDQAKDARSQDDWATCYAKAKAAWGVQHHPRIAGPLGDCALDLGKARESAESLTFYLKHRSANDQPELVGYLEKRLEEAKSAVGTVRLQLSVPAATVLVDGQAVDGQLVDGKRLVFLEPGTHQLVATHPGYQQLERQLLVAAGGEHELSLTLLRIPVSHNGESGPDAGSAYPWLVGSGIVLTTLGIGFGIGLAVAANDQLDEARQLEATQTGCAHPCAPVREAFADADTLYSVSGGLFIGAGLAAVATIAYGVLAPVLADPPASAAIVPSAGPGVAGVAVVGTF